MKLSILLFSLFISVISVGQTKRISSFSELMQALNSGKQVRAVIQYGLCQWAPSENKSTPTPKAVTGLQIDTYEYFPAATVHNKNGFVVFSNAKLIKNPRGKGYVINYGKIRIEEDQSVQITATYLHPKSNKELMSEVFVGKLNDGKNGEGISLFDESK